MPSSRSGRNPFQRLTLLVLGVSFGMLLVQIFQRFTREMQHQREYQATHPGYTPSLREALRRALTLSVVPETQQVGQAIKLPTLSETRKDLPLTVSVSPTHLSHNQPCTVRVETLSGATCTLNAVYSTHRKPLSFSDAHTVVIGESGQHEWTWEVGSAGSFVDLTVEGWLEGYDMVIATLRVEIGA